MIRKYYTLKEVMYDAGGFNTDYETGYYITGSFTNNLKEFIKYCLALTGTDNISPLLDDRKVLELWIRYIANRRLNDAVGYYDWDKKEEDIPTNVVPREVKYEFAQRFMGILNATYNEYSLKLNYCDEQKSNLLNQISSKSYSKFNDTPQNIGVYTNDPYTTTYTESGSVTDGANLMERLDEINRLYNDIYETWARKFWGLFMYD